MKLLLASILVFLFNIYSTEGEYQFSSIFEHVGKQVLIGVDLGYPCF